MPRTQPHHPTQSRRPDKTPILAIFTPFPPYNELRAASHKSSGPKRSKPQKKLNPRWFFCIILVFLHVTKTESTIKPL